jgi:hypothetical protein
VNTEGKPVATCGSCGSELMPNARFCTRCGTRVASPDPTMELPAAASQASPGLSQQPATPLRQQPIARPSSAFFGGMLGALGAGIGCLLLLGLLFAGCVALLSNVH